MERRPSSNIQLSTVSMPPRRRQFRDMPTTIHRAVDAPPRIICTPPAIQKTPSPVVPVSADVPLPVSQAHAVQADIQSLLAGQLSSETRRAYRGDLRHFLNFISHPEALDNPTLLPQALATIDRATATAYRDHLMTVEKRAAATVNRRLATINVIFNALCEEGIIVKNPFSWVKRPKVGNVGKTPAFTKEQAESIIAQPDVAKPTGRRDRILLLLLFWTGLRRGEVVKVAKDDFYESQGHIMLRVHGKGRGDKRDSVLIPMNIWSEVQTYLESVEGLLFTAQSRNTRYNRKDTPLSTTSVYLLFKEYCRMAGIDAAAFSPHSTRATFITLCLAGGADIRNTMFAARHTDPATTIRYDRQRLNLENHPSNFLNLETTGALLRCSINHREIIPSPS